MLAQFVTIWLATLTVGSPIAINSTIANIENSLSTLAESLISRGPVNNTERYESADGHTRIAILPAQTTTLQEILFHPTNQHLVAENKTKLFSNATTKVDLIKVDLVTDSTTAEHHEPTGTTIAPTTIASSTTTTNPPDTTKLQILQAVPTTIVQGTTEPATVVTVTINIESTQVSKNETASVEIVTPQHDVALGNGTSTTIATTSSTTEKETESKEIRDKVKEVEAEPVILTVGV